jgi:serine/threonine-protein kinase
MLDTEKGELPHEVALSPDGSRIAYLDGGKLWVRDLDDPDSRMVVDAAITEMRPFWSPDSDWLGFADGKQLKKVSVQGGVATPVCNTKSSFSTGGAGGAWSRDGRIVFSQGSSGLYEVPASGGDPKLLHDIEPMVESDFHQPQFLPGDKDLIFVQHRLRHGPDTILLLRDGKRSTVLRVEGSNLSKPCYAPSGHILYHRFGEGLGLWAVPFSLDSGKTTGDPLLVSSEGSGPSVGTDGSLLYTRGDVSSYGQLVWVDRSGNVVESLSEPLGLIQSLALSPDGGRAAVSINEAGNRDIWLMDLGRGTKTRLTFSKAYENQGTWFPDGSAIAFTDTDEWKILLRTIDGTGPPIPLVKGRSPEFSRDGRFLVYQLEESQNRGDIWAKELRADSQTVAIVQTQADETDPALSPDGRLLAYRSDESGSDEIYLTRFPSADGKWQVSSRGGYSPRWNGSGSRIYYLEDQSLMEVAVELKGGVTLGSPRKVFDLGPAELQYWGWKTYGVAADDRRFFFAKRTRIQGQKTSIVLVQDWHSEFSAPK